MQVSANSEVSSGDFVSFVEELSAGTESLVSSGATAVASCLIGSGRVVTAYTKSGALCLRALQADADPITVGGELVLYSGTTGDVALAGMNGAVGVLYETDGGAKPFRPR